MIKFVEWMRFREVSTDTSCIAGFQRIAAAPVRRKWLGPWDEEDPFFKKKLKKQQTDID